MKYFEAILILEVDSNSKVTLEDLQRHFTQQMEGDSSNEVLGENEEVIGEFFITNVQLSPSGP